MTTQRLSGWLVCVFACAGMLFALPNVALALPIAPAQVTYSYPGQQPRGDLNVVYGDTGGGQLSDGFVPADSFASGNWVGFNDDIIQSGQPEPRIDFDLGGTYNLNSTSITYVAGGLAGILGPDSLEVRYSTNGGATYSAAPDVTFTGFNQSDDNASQFPVTDVVGLAGVGVTHVRLDFIQDQDAGNGFSEWVFLGEVNFDGVGMPNPGPSQEYKDAVLADSPVLYWTFDENSGNAASLVNTSAANELMPQGAAGRVASHITGTGIDLGQAASFNGTNGTRFFSNTLDVGGPTVFNHYAVELWAQLDNMTAASYLLEAGLGGGGASGNSPAIIHAFLGPDLELEGFFGGGGRTGDVNPLLTEFLDGGWHHLVMEVDTGANTHSFFIDGQLIGTFPGSTAWDLPTLGVGATQFGVGLNPTDGQIDELAFYDLSQGLVTGQDIANHFNVAPPGVPEPASTTLALLAGAALLRRRKRVGA